MRSSIPRVAALLLAAAAYLCLAEEGRAQAAPQIVVSISFPDGSAKSTPVTLTEVERVTGQRPAYTLLPWVVAAFKKLELDHTTDKDSKGVTVTAIAGIANGSQGTWVYSANGHRSPYRLNTQTIEGISSVSFAYHLTDQ